MSNTTVIVKTGRMGLPIGAVVFLILFVCKLGNVWGLGDLSWVWVTAPLWWVFGLLAVLFAIVMVASGALIVGAVVLDYIAIRKRRNEAKKQMGGWGR